MSTPPSAQLSPAELFDQLAQYSPLVADLVLFGVVTVTVYLVGRLAVVPFLAGVVRARNDNNPTLVTATETYLAVALVGVAVFAGLVATGQANVVVGTDSAIVVAALTFAFGVAGQEVFGSLISGFFLVADPDFNVGDWISWPGGQGTIEAVDFRVTRVRTPDNETVTVPNTELTTNALTRPFGRESYRITEQVYVDYAEDTEHALMELRQAAEVADRVLDDPAPTSRIVELGSGFITLQAEFWVADPATGGLVDIRSDFRRRVKLRFDEEGMTLAPPTDQRLAGAVALEGDAPTAD
jgi:small-conductance mechanosensitive channel